MNSTFINKDPRIAWIGNPHQQNCMVEAGTGSLPTKIHPEKKPQSKKTRRYSVYSINATRSHIFFRFCEQTLKMAANDASGQGLQSALKNRHQNIFFEKVMSQKPIFSFRIFMLQSISRIQSTVVFKMHHQDKL